MSSQAIAVSNVDRRVLSAGTLIGDRVRNAAREDLGKIEDIMIDLQSGNIAYAVLSFGGFLGMGDKLFAVPWSSLQLDGAEHEFILDVDKSVLENAPGFDKDNWPEFADSTFGSQIHSYYGKRPYWEERSTEAYATSYDAGGVRTEARDAQVDRERINQPDLPEELRRRPTDVTNFPGREADADLKTADASRTYAVNDTTSWNRK